MLKRFFPLLASIFLLGSCTSLKQLGTSLNKPVIRTSALAAKQNQPNNISSNEIKFLEDISASVQTSVIPVTPTQTNNLYEASINAKKNNPVILIEPSETYEAVSPVPLQYKYAQLLETEANEIHNLKLFEFIDDWYGVRYRMGGTTKKGIDCSALVQSLFTSIYGVALPRTSKEQYKHTRRISATELQEGDLLFFHTRGRGVSHVGVYLQNNKFVHASSSGGVMISDMYEDYFVKRLLGTGRVDK